MRPWARHPDGAEDAAPDDGGQLPARQPEQESHRRTGVGCTGIGEWESCEQSRPDYDQTKASRAGAHRADAPTVAGVPLGPSAREVHDEGMRIPVALVPVAVAIVLGATALPAGASPAPGAAASGAGAVQKAYPAAATPAAVSCPTRSDCAALGRGAGDFSIVLRSTTGGRSWRTETLPGHGAFLDSITCPTASDCYVVGAGPGLGTAEIAATTDGGAAG